MEMEKEEDGEDYERENKAWSKFEFAPFKTRQQQFIICLNTLGQDRQFTQEEINFALNTVQVFADTWEKLEQKNLEHDVQLKLKYSEFDRIYREFYNARDEARLEEIIDEAIAAAEAQQMADGEDPLTDSDKERITKKTRFDVLTKGFYAPEAYAQYKAGLELEGNHVTATAPDIKGHKRNQSGMSSVKSHKDGDKKSVGSVEGEANVPPYTPLVPQQWLERCQEFGKFHIIKFPRLFQILFYFTRFKKREDLCYFDTNKLSWKKAREFLVAKRAGEPDLFSSIGNYTPFGPKEEEYAEY